LQPWLKLGCHHSVTTRVGHFKYNTRVSQVSKQSSCCIVDVVLFKESRK